MVVFHNLTTLETLARHCKLKLSTANGISNGSIISTIDIRDQIEITNWNQEEPQYDIKPSDI